MNKDTYHKIVKFLISGGSAMFASITTLYFLTEIVHLWYLLSSVLAFIVGLLINFILQKIWVFHDSSYNTVMNQALIFSVLGIANLIANTALIYIFTEKLYIWYIYSQVISAGILAVVNFIIYYKVIFRNSRKTS